MNHDHELHPSEEHGDEGAYDLERKVMIDADRGNYRLHSGVTQQTFDEMIADHEKWLSGHGGKRLSLNGISLFGLEAKGRNLDKATLSNCVLDYCDFSGASLSHVTIAWCHMKGTNFSNSTLDNSAIAIRVAENEGPSSSPTIPVAIFSGSKFRSSSLSCSKKEPINLVFGRTANDVCDTSGTEFISIDFQECKGKVRVSLGNETMKVTRFIDCSIFDSTMDIRVNSLSAENCRFVFVQNCFGRQILDGSRFSNCSFTYCFFEKSSLSGSLFRRCRFNGGGFPNANLSTNGFMGETIPTEFADCESQDTTFRSARMNNIVMNRAKLIRAKFNAASDLSGGSFIEANFLNSVGLDQARKAGANFSGAIWADGSTCGFGSIGLCKRSAGYGGAGVLGPDEYDSAMEKLSRTSG